MEDITNKTEKENTDNKSEIVVGLDIGTTKITAINGKKDQYGKLEILGTGKAVSNGVSRGVVANIDKTVDSIKIAVEDAEKESGITIDEVYVGIAGQHIKSLQHRGEMVRDDIDEEITKSDLNKLDNNMFKLVTIPGEEVIHVIPQEYTVDGEDFIQDPKGMAGVHIEANFHIITAKSAAVKNIIRCVTKAGLKPKDLILEPESSALDKSTNSEDMEKKQILISLKDTRTVTLSGVTIPHWNLSITSRNCKRLTAANHAAGVAGGSVSKARKNIKVEKTKSAMNALQSRVNTMNAMTMGEWTPGANGHLDHGQEKSEVTAQNRGKFMVQGMTPRSVGDDDE